MALNIICLHGFTQNTEIFKKKLSKLTKSAKGFNLYFLDGSIILPNPDAINSRAYWVYDNENPMDAIWTDHYKSEIKIYGLDESLDALINLGKQIGKVDGIIGFSQGGCFTDYICKMYSIGKIPFDIRFAIFISAEYFNRSDYEFENIQPSIQTLHMYGKADTIIPNSMSEKLANYYPNKEVFIHEGTHIVPSTSAAKNAFRKLISQF